MANLWQFFGLPNPEAPNNSDKKSKPNSNKAKMAKAQEDASQQTLIPIEEGVIEILNPVISVKLVLFVVNPSPLKTFTT